MNKIDPELMYLSKAEKDRFDTICKEFYKLAIADKAEYDALLKEIENIKAKFPEGKQGVNISKHINKFIHKKIPLAKKFSYFLIIPTVSMYISNAYVYNDKFFEEARYRNENYFLQYINLVTMFTLTHKYKERCEIKKDLELLDKGYEQSLPKPEKAKPKAKPKQKTVESER